MLGKKKRQTNANAMGRRYPYAQVYCRATSLSKYTDATCCGGQHSQSNESPLSSTFMNPIRVNVMRRYCSYVIALWRRSYLIQSLEHNSL